MNNEKPKKLYPLHFEPVAEEMPWGTQTWALADLGFVNSEITEGWLAGNAIEDVMETYIERVVGESCYQYYGRQFPVAVSYLDIHSRTPLQVHPDDEEAMHRYDALGKAQLFYIAEASADARLYLGFNREMTAQELYTRCLDGEIWNDLHVIEPKAGDYYIVKPGLVNAFDGHLKVAVIQESSAIDLVLHDPNPAAAEDALAAEDLKMTHLSEAIDLIDYRPYDLAVQEVSADDASANDADQDASANAADQAAAAADQTAAAARANDADQNASANAADPAAADAPTASGKEAAAANTAAQPAAAPAKAPTDKATDLLCARPEFTVSRIRLSDPLQMNLEHLGCFLIYTCIEGAASIQIPSVNERNEKCMENYEFKKGETILVPAEIAGFFLVPRDRDTILLETMVESHEEIDSYINPNTEPFLEGEDYEGLEDGDFDDDEENDCGDDCCCGHHHDGDDCDGDCHCGHDHEDGDCHCGHDHEDGDCHCGHDHQN